MPAEFDAGDRFDELGEAVAGKQERILNAIGAYLTARSQRAFRDQAFDGNAWRPRSVPNIPGIVNDLNKGGQPKARRFQATPVLTDTGHLRRSITWQVSGNSVLVGTTLEYASVHQNGGVTKPVPLTEVGRQGLTALLRRRPQLRDDLGWLFARPISFSRVPARPFVGLQEGDLEEIERIIAAEVTS